MNASHEWLRAFVPLDASPVRLRDLLTAHTATVEELAPLRTDLAPIVVARVLEAARHPDSDHLWVTKVDAGDEPLEVICGAPNVTAGKRYPFAPVGTTMPNGMKIERRRIRGVASNGMLCSARELGLGDDHQGILELHVDVPPGTPFLAAMPVGDTRLVIDVGANRPDLLSHLGLARELSVVTGQPWRLPEIPGLPAAIPLAAPTAVEGTTGGVRVRVEDETRTRRYLGAVVRGVKVGPSPEWLVRRLEAVGARSISNVVDATNYVLHELGQPVHAFDLARLSGGEVIVRKASPQEQFTTLDGAPRTLPPDTVVIADGARGQAIAGIMGGAHSEVSPATRDIFIEVASFDPKLTRAARRGLGLSTDASYRFERGVDPHLAPLAMDRVVRLILLLAGGTLAGAPVDVVATLLATPRITLRWKRVRQVLGEDVPPDRAAGYLRAAGFELEPDGNHALSVRVPSWRTDVLEEIDLVEEVARFHGYDTFPDEIRPFRPSTTHDDPLWSTANRVREALVGLGMLETRPMPFVDGTPGTHVRVANPVSENEGFLRTSVIETLARRAEFNLAQRSRDVRLFEIGAVFASGAAALPREQTRVGLVLMGRRRPPHFTEPEPPLLDEWDAAGHAETAARSAFPGEPVALRPAEGTEALWDVVVSGRAVGRVSRLALDAPVWAAPAFAIEITLGDVATEAPAPPGQHAYGGNAARPASRAVSRFVPLPAMPAAEFDLALLVPVATAAADVERVIRDSAGELLERLDLFDQYTGKGIPSGFRSLAWRLTFRHPERTLRDKEIEGRRAKILSSLDKELHVRQRTV